MIDMGDNREIAYKSLQILTHFPITSLIIVTAPEVVKAIAPSYNLLRTAPTTFDKSVWLIAYRKWQEPGFSDFSLYTYAVRSSATPLPWHENLPHNS